MLPKIDDFIELAKKQRSYRHFKPNPVPKEHIEKILEAARWAPSGANAQPWEFVVVEDVDTKKRLVECFKGMFELIREHDPIFKPIGAPAQASMHTAPVNIVVLNDKRTLEAPPDLPGVREEVRAHDMGIAIQHINLAAVTLGLGTCWVTVITKEISNRIREVLGVPEAFEVDHIIPLGYPDETKEDMSNSERARNRRELKEILHYSKYQKEKFRSDEQIKEFIKTKTVTRS